MFSRFLGSSQRVLKLIKWRRTSPQNISMSICISEHPVFPCHFRLRMFFSARDQNLFPSLNLAPVQTNQICGSLRGYRLDFNKAPWLRRARLSSTTHAQHSLALLWFRGLLINWYQQAIRLIFYDLTLSIKAYDPRGSQTTILFESCWTPTRTKPRALDQYSTLSYFI